MSEYTPDTDEVRDKYIGQGFVDGELKEYTEFARERIGAEFDRWLAEVERAAAARALTEAADEWTQGAWADYTPPRDAILPQILMAMAQRPGDWLRTRAAEIREGKSE